MMAGKEALNVSVFAFHLHSLKVCPYNMKKEDTTAAEN
jgi:hypothetical protein